MKLAIGLVCSFAAFAQTGTVPMKWVASITPGVSYNVYRAPGPCNPEPTTFVKVNTVPITSTSYTDQNVPAGLWCYRSTAFIGALESVPSNTYDAAVSPEPPTGFTVGIQVTVNVTVNGVSAQPSPIATDK